MGPAGLAESHPHNIQITERITELLILIKIKENDKYGNGKRTRVNPCLRLW